MQKVGRAQGVKRYFVTGTDTGVGKTWCSAALLTAAAAAGKQSCGFKPVASEADAVGENQDVLRLRQASAVKLDYQQHNLYTFDEATAPHLAAQEQGCVIDAAAISAQLQQLESVADWIIIEGAGGWHTPLSEQLYFSRWVQSEQLPVVLVVGMKLGCLNHAILTAQAVAAAGLPLVGWIANAVTEHPHRYSDYLQTLQRCLPAPLLGEMPYLPGADLERAASHLSLSSLL